MTIGEKIQTLRKQHGMSQDQLADALDISRQAVSKWETNENQPDIERLIEISNLFNVSTDYLIKDGSATTTKARPARKNEDESGFRASRISFLVSAIYSAATVIFLILGFGWGLWHPAWIIFFIPPIVVRLLAQFMAKSVEDYEAFEDALNREDD
jgi:transcriptional regulator with XRE-family HTH domain